MTAFDTVRDSLIQRTGKQPQRRGPNLAFPCPSHHDPGPSLHIRDGGGRCLILCRAGCDTKDVLIALGLTEKDLYDDADGKDYARYEYTDILGKVTRVVHRRDGKNFTQSGDRQTNQLFELPAVVAGVKAGERVWLVEGEADVLMLGTLGEIATTAPQGAINFNKVDVSPLKGATVIAVMDNDAAGEKWAEQVRARLAGFAADLSFVKAKEGKDASDHFLYGHGIDDFILVEEPGRHSILTSAADTVIEASDWLYEERIPTGGITLLAGREGIGKSTISYDLAASVTRGDLPGEFIGKPKGVIVCAGEDSWERVIVPRLIAAKADRSLVWHMGMKTEEGTLVDLNLPNDIPQLWKDCQRKNVGLVIIDPLMSFISSKLDTHVDASVRIALNPLAKFTAETGVAVLALIHVNKSGTQDPGDSIMGSRAFTAVPRSVLYCIVDPEADRDDRYLFGHTKSSYGPIQPSIGYHLIGVTLPPPNGKPKDIKTSKVVWDAVDSRLIREIMAGNQGRGTPSDTAKEIIAWVREQGRTVSSREIQEGLPDINEITLRSQLRKLVLKGKLVKPVHGHYAVP